MNFFHDTQRQLLIYPGQPDFVLKAIPEARQLNGSYFAVPATLRNSQVMRYFNYPVAPVMGTYDWPRHPSIKQPYESQKLAAEFMVLHRRCFNLSDMGTGKTMSVLWAADFLMRHHDNFRALIVCPLSIMQRVWADALVRNFLGKRTFAVLHGTPEKRALELARPADFYIINFEGVGVGAHTRKKFELDGFSKALAERGDIRLAVVDEASGYKDSTTKRHRIAREVIGKRDYLFLLTGTPTPNAPTDAYGLAKLVNNAYGKSKQGFQLETMAKVGQFRWVPRKDGYETARKLLQPAIRFEIGQVWDGPEMTTQQREVQLTDQQKKLMGDLKRDLVIQVKSGVAITTANEAAARTKFMQISMGAVYDENHKVHLVDAKPRIEELKAVLAEAPGKVLIFAGLTSVVNLLYKELKSTRQCAVVNGDVSQKDRSDIFSAFQADSTGAPDTIIADPGTMSHGLDLWQARTTIWYGPVDKTELYLQANRRAHRPGQKFPTTVVQLVSNPLEREIFRRLETNESLQGAMLDMVKRGEL